jgi:hypothetical protein
MLGITSTPIPCVDKGLGTSNKPWFDREYQLP